MGFDGTHLDEQFIADMVGRMVAEGVRGGIGEYPIRSTVLSTMAALCKAVGVDPGDDCLPDSPAAVINRELDRQIAHWQVGQDKPPARN